MTSSLNKRIAYCGVFTALAMIFSYVEFLIPISLGVPGVKLGIANIAIIAVLYVVGSKEAVIVNLLRITLTGILFGNLYSFLFSLSGGILSLLVMILLKKSKLFSTLGISVAGAVAHNAGQIIAAVLLLENGDIAYYYPVLAITRIITGVVIGIVSNMVVVRVVHGVNRKK